MSTIATAIRKFIRALPESWVPQNRLTVTDSRAEPPSMAPDMTVERIHGAILEAQAGSTRNLFAVYRDMILTDSHLQTEIFKRKLAVLGDALQFAPVDRKLAADIDTAAAVDKAITGFRGWTRANAFLLDASLYPVSVMEKVYRQEGNAYVLDQLVPVPYQLLDFSDGHLKIFDADPTTGYALSTKRDPDPNRYIVHRGHILSTPDNWGGPMRSILFWWLLSTMSREWWSKFLERFGAPFLVGKFHDEEGRSILSQAFSAATRLGGLVISEETSVELKEAAATNSGDAYGAFITLCQREKSKLVLGQTLSTEAQPTGLGSGVSNMQEEVRQDIRQFDARLLSETLRDQLITQFCTINRLPGQPPLLIWGSESKGDIQSTMGMLKGIADSGLEVSDDSLSTLSEKVGLQLQRSSQPRNPFAQPGTFSVSGVRRLPSHLDSIATAGSPDLSRTLRETLAPIARIIRESRSAQECETQIRAFCVGWDPSRVSSVVEQSLESYVANGSLGRK